MNGKISHKESVMLLPGINNKTLDIQTLSAGIYELSFMTKNGIAKTKFVKH
jgi:hypothetical protein